VTPRAVLIAAVLAGVVSPPGQSSVPARTLVATIPVHDVLSGGERVTFTFDVPAGNAAHVTVTQEGIDVSLVLRRRDAVTPTHGVDLVGGLAGVEHLYPAIDDAPAAWDVVVRAPQPRTENGAYTILLETSAADDRARAVAAAREIHYRAAQPAAVGDEATTRREEELYAAAGRAAASAGDLALAAECTYQYARHRDVLGDTPAAVQEQARALEMFRRLGRPDREARVLNRLGDLSRKTGEVVDSEKYFEQALPLARAAGDAPAIVDILNNSGLLLQAIGRYDESIDRLAAAIPLSQELGSADVEGALTHNLGLAYHYLGDDARAIEYYKRSIEVKQRLRLPRRIASTQIAMADSYFEIGDRAKAEETVDSAVALYEQAGDRLGLADAIGRSGLIRHAAGEIPEAIALFARARPMLHEAQSRGGESAVLTAWAQVDLDRGDPAAALSKADEAVALARAIANPHRETKASYVRALALRRAGQLPAAVEAIADAVKTVEATRSTLRRSDLRTSYLAAVDEYFDLYVDLLQQQGQAAAAFEMSERSRARTLLEGLAQSAGQIRKGVDAALVAHRRALQTQIEAKENYRAQLSLQGDKTAPVAAEGKAIAELRERLAGVERTIRSASPSYWALQQPVPIDAARIQRTLLDANTALVEYHVGRERSYAWVIDRASVASFELPAEQAIEDLARRYHEALSRDIDALAAPARERVAADVAALGRRLASAVWSPLASRVRGKRVLIVADGALQYVPFAALPERAGASLIEGHEIVYLPSASVLDTLRHDSGRQATRGSAAVFADPVFSKNDPRFAAARDMAAPSRTRAADGGEYGRLRFSRREAEAIAAVSPGAFQALDFAASKGALVSRRLRDYRILHFATHGVLNTQRPEMSGLVFSLVDRGGQPIDGFLRLHEIYNLDLDAELVVLSACRTALGKEVHGEGLIGLTRGFMYAGATRVVSSVWNVDDRASAQLMKRFYEAMLRRKLAPAAALRDAQISLLRDPRWANPHYWAAFGAFGEPN
jgi:CHAT domain-containing protein